MEGSARIIIQEGGPPPPDPRILPLARERGKFFFACAGVIQVRRLNDFRPAAGRAGRGCFGRRSGLDTSFVGASAPKKILGDFLILPSSRLPVPDLRVGFVKRD